MKRTRLLTIRFLVAVACGIASAVLISGPAAADDDPDFAAIDRYVRSEMDAQRIPGLALGIVQGDRIVHVQGFGEADKSGRDVTPETPFLIGSVTKSFTALAIMQLSEAGQVQLDAPVQRYLPWWRVADPDASTQITVRHLLYQVSGLSRNWATRTRPAGTPTPPPWRIGFGHCTMPSSPHRWGTTWQYSNANYWTLGMVVQAVSGQSYETYVQQHIFAPLQMHNSYTSGDRGGSERPAHRPPLLVRLPRRLRGALRPRRPGFRRPQLQRGGHDPLPQPLTSTVADMTPPRWSPPPVPPSCSGRVSPPAWTASRTRWAGTWARSMARRRSPTTAAASTPTPTSTGSRARLGRRGDGERRELPRRVLSSARAG